MGYTVLQKNTSSYSSIHCHNLALGDHQGSQDIIAVPLAETNSLVSGRLDNDPKGKKTTINISTLDLFCEENNISEISILKTDTEGYDLQVLQGSRKMLEASKIGAIYIEATFKRESKVHTFFPGVLEFLDSFGMRFIGIYETEPLSQTHVNADLYCNALFLNEIQMHNERKSR